MFVVSCFPRFIRSVPYKEINVHLGIFKTHVFNNSEPRVMLLLRLLHF